MRIIKETDDKRDIPFLGYAKNAGLTDESKALEFLKQAREKTAKSNDKSEDEFGAEDMAEVWKNFKDMVKDNKGKKESTIKESADNQLIKVGDNLTNNEGAIFNVLNIWIDNFHLKPEAWLEVEWTLNNKRGKQKISADSFKKNYFK